MTNPPVPGEACTPSALGAALAEKMNAATEELAHRWLERIADRVSLHPNSIFPTQELLDHIPLLIKGIGDYIGNPADAITADMPVVAKAIELGNLRHAQGFEASEILKEYEILGGILFDFLITNIDTVDTECSRGELLACANSLFKAVLIVQQVTADQFLRAAAESVREREQRLRGFNGAVSHEVKNRLGLVVGALEMLQEEFILKDPERVKHFSTMLTDNVRGLGLVVDDLIALSRIESTAAQQRNVLLADAVAEAVRQLRDFAAARGVEVRIAEELPAVEVPAAIVELSVTNYVANAIKYRDPGKTGRYVEVRGRIDNSDTPECELVVEVHDNGLGVPDNARASLFKRFYRAHTDLTDEQGSGLGLSIVRDVVDSAGGRAWADFGTNGETVFAFAIPCNRDGAPVAV